MKKKYNYKEIPGLLQDLFFKQFICSFLLILLGIVFFIYFKYELSTLCAFIIISLFISIRTLYQIFKCMDGDILKYEGICVEIPKESRRIKGRKFITLKLNPEFYLKVPLTTKTNVELNNIVVVFCPKNAAIQQGDDYGMLTNTYLIHVQKRNIKEAIKESIEQLTKE